MGSGLLGATISNPAPPSSIPPAPPPAPPPQYTDAGLYTCSSGQRPYKIPGSYGEIWFPRQHQHIYSQCQTDCSTFHSSAVQMGLGFSPLVSPVQVTMSRTLRPMLTGEWSVSAAGTDLHGPTSTHSHVAAPLVQTSRWIGATRTSMGQSWTQGFSIHRW